MPRNSGNTGGQANTQRGGRRLAGQNAGIPEARRRTALRRAQQSLRDRAISQMNAQNALLASIPRGPPKTKQELFTTGALRTVQFAPRGHGYYDAFVQTPDSAVVAATTGPATIIKGNTSDTVSGGQFLPHGTTFQLDPSNSNGSQIPVTTNAMIYMFNPGSSDSQVAKSFALEIVNGSVAVKTTTYSARQFQDLGPTISTPSQIHGAPDQGRFITEMPPQEFAVQGGVVGGNYGMADRVESIPLRGSLRIRNVTESLSVGGVVRILRYNGGLSFKSDGTPASELLNSGYSPTVSQFLDLKDMVTDSPRSKVFSGHEMCETHQSNAYPADFVRSMAFEKDRSFFEAVAAPPFCTIIVLIDEFASSTSGRNNSYEFTVAVQRAARFGPGTLLHSMARSLPVAPNENRRNHQEEESKAPASKLSDRAAQIHHLVKKFAPGFQAARRRPQLALQN